VVELGVVVFEEEASVEGVSVEAPQVFEWVVPGLAEHHLGELGPVE